MGPRPRHAQHARRRRCFGEQGGVKRALSLPLTVQNESDRQSTDGIGRQWYGSLEKIGTVVG